MGSVRLGQMDEGSQAVEVNRDGRTVFDGQKRITVLAAREHLEGNSTILQRLFETLAGDFNEREMST